ncbi:universal stress protein [Rhodococcus sp. G-MC3]|uniref:universal stress protein n=1 Tax=Rhodococcus sp. G-MC3 TaxID=3046209 RepID=UPI0024B8B418|nr:universal stress protein [Rhodococcus sp. G-MC3]MDJ0396480.1 universal stress protein [Rhodococcus sp. G-MC3]
MNSSAERTQPVLVCVDGSDETIAATRWAASYAARVHAPLRIVHTVPSGDWYGSAAFVDGGELEEGLRSDGRGHLARASKAALSASPGLSIETVLADGSLADFVATVQAELIVLGTARTNYAHEIALGSNTIRVVNHTQSPVLVWRPGVESVDTGRPIVVGVDGSEASTRAFAVALEMAHTLDAPIVAANYWGLAIAGGMGSGAGYIDWSKVRADEQSWLDTQVEVMGDKYPDVTVTTESLESSAARGLRALSSTARIVAVGSRGRGVLRGAALGSVSQSLVHHAECSVLIVR